MSTPRVRSGRLAKTATLLMVALGLVTIFINVDVAIVIIALGMAMFLFERWLVRRVNQPADEVSPSS